MPRLGAFWSAHPEVPITLQPEKRLVDLRPEALTWLRSFGLRPDAMNIAYIPTEELALSAARQGYGLHVEAAALVEQDIERGAVQIVGSVKDDGLAYYMVSRPGPKRPQLTTFIRLLKAAV